MCNAYTLHRATMKAVQRGEDMVLTDRQKQLLEAGDGRYVVRPTLAAPVIVREGEDLPWMRWGFERPWAKAINNARMEKRTSGMWKKAWAAGRCLIPMAGWFEFTGETGNMTCHLLEPEETGPLLAAGLWEEHVTHGPCFTMVMTEAEQGSMLAGIHNRMPVILTPEDGERWLLEPIEDLKPSAGIVIRESIVPSPLKRSKSGPAAGAG